MNGLKQVKEHLTNFLKNCKRFFTIKSLLTILAAPGVVQGYQILNYVLEKQIREEKSARIAQLSTYQNFGEIIKKYQGEIADKVVIILDSESSKYKKILKDPNFCDLLLEKHGKGLNIFYSKEFKEYRDVHNFYETLGLFLHHDVVDFDLVFSLFTFPGEFIEGEYSSEYPSKNPLIALDGCIGQNWFGKNNGLTDYGVFIKEVGYNYNFARLKLKLDQKETAKLATLQAQIKKLEDNQCQPFYPFDPAQSNKVYWNKFYSKKYGLFQEINRFVQGIARRC